MFRSLVSATRRRRLARRLLSAIAATVSLLPIIAYVAAPVAQAAPAQGYTATGHPNPANDKSACAKVPAGTLCVRAAEDSLLPGPGLGGEGPSKNDPVPHYKWLLNRDNSGSVTMGPDGKTPIASEVTKCHPITPTFPNGNPNYPNALNGSGPILADGSPNPLACNWPSIQSATSSPVVSAGTDSDWGPASSIPFYSSGTGRGLPDGRYLVSVTSGGYQIGGAHFVVAGGHITGLDATANGAVVVSLNPLPIPLSNVRLKVYGDMASSNGQWDEQSEYGLPGFAGHLADFVGPVNVDYYNNPLCTAYQLIPKYTSAHPDPTDSYYQVKLGLDGRPIIDATHHIRGNFEVDGPATGRCTSDANGNILIPYLAPNRYGASVVADPVAGVDPVTHQTVDPQQVCPVLGTADHSTVTAGQTSACWVQTTTLEGNHDFDAWPQANSTGYDTELLVAGELVPEVQFGFVRAGCMVSTATGTVDFSGLTDPNRWLDPSSCGNSPRTSGPTPTGGIKGKIMGANAYYPGLGALPGTGGNAGTAGYKFDRPVHHPWVTLSDLNNGDKTVWAGNAALDGSFLISGVPDGSYSVAVWDQMQDYIFDSFNVTVAGGKVVDLGVVPLLEWWTRITGKICIDANGNGRCDPGEAGVPKFLVQNLNRTNNLQEGGQNTDVTDDQGNYGFTEAYPLGYNDVIQAFNTRWKTTGVTWQACNDPHEHTTLTAAVDVQYNPVIAQCGRLDWAVQPYSGATATQRDPNRAVTRTDNGGIVATVVYDAVRSRYLGRGQVPADYFTGIPGVLTELFQPVKAPDTAPAMQVCNGLSVPNVSYNHYFLNCDGSYRTTGATGGYSTTYSAGAVLTTDRYGAANPGTVNAYQSEHYARATGCVARDANGKIISGTLGANGKVRGTMAGGNTVTDFLPGLSVDPASANPGHYAQACIEASATGVAFGLGTDNLPLDPNVPAGPTHGSQTVDGNFGLTPTDASGNPAVGDFLAKVDIPGDTVLPPVSPGVDRPLYKIADETSANNFAGAGLAAYTPDLGTGDKGQPGHASTPQFVPQNADLSHVYNADGTPHTNLGGSCPMLDGTTGTRACVAFSFPPQAAKPDQMPVAVPVTGGDSPTSLVEDPNTASPSPDNQCAGPQFTVNVTDPGFLSAGGSPMQGLTRNSCDVHLIHVGAGQSVAPNFYLYTDVPTPTTFVVQNFDDTNLSTNKVETQYGDAAPIPNSPEGVYDWHGNLVDQFNVDPNGIAVALLPSTDVANCATPAGICQNTYRFVGNDPGTIDHPNVNYNPQYQTITANFQALPGVFTPADTAPTRSALAFLNAGQKFAAAADCGVSASAPQLFSVNRPYTDSSPAHPRTVVIKGLGFGATQGSGTVTLTGSGIANATTITSWSDTEIHAAISDAVGPGKYQLAVTNNSGATTVNGISYYIIGDGFRPAVLEVGTGPAFSAEATTLRQWRAQRQFPSIQEAIERAAGYWLRPVNGNLVYTREREHRLNNAIVVVYPAADNQQSPPNSAVSPGVWYEPIIVHSAVTVQGVGPGGVQPPTATRPATAVPGSVIDGRYFFSLTDTTSAPAVIDWATAPQDVRAQHAVDVWQHIATALFPNTPATDNKLVTEGQDVTVLAQKGQREYGPDAHPVLDGFGVQAAITIKTPTNVNANTGQRTGPAGGANATQGGAIFLNGHDDSTQVTNNVIEGNQGSYGAIRLGSPQVDNQHNWNVEFGNNQIVANGGNNLGGGTAFFNDSGGYNVHDNLICGNQSAEYGGGLSQYGLSIAPVDFTGRLSGNTLTYLAGGTNTSPFTPGDVGRSVTGNGLQGVTIRSVARNRQSVTLTGEFERETFNESMIFRYIPSAAAFQTASNVVSHNTITLNQSQDEGGGIMIAGQLPQNSAKPSLGAGPVIISGNVVSANAANDDGGGLRFLQAGNFPMRVENNMINNNVSAHEGGGISIDDTAQVTIINDTIAKNITTATASTSNGSPDPAGISTAHNSAPFQATLPVGSPTFSNPVIANDIIYDNRSGSWNAGTSDVSGIGQPGDTAPLNIWDVGIADPGIGLLAPTRSVLSTPPNALGGKGYTGSATNVVTVAPTTTSANAVGFVAPFNLTLQVAPMRINFRFRVTAIVNIGLPANAVGNYRISIASPAHGLGASQVSPLPGLPYPNTAILAPTVDIYGVSRISRSGSRFDAGAAQATP